MIFGALISSLVICDLKNKFVVLLIITTLLFSAIGFIDDYKKFTVNKDGLAGRKKLMLQTIIAIIVWIFIKEFGITGNKIIDF